MTSDLDIYRTANELIKQHGDDAPIQAAMRADEMLEKGDLDGKRVWLRIMKAVDEMLAKEPLRHWGRFYLSARKNEVLDDRTTVMIHLAAAMSLDCEP